ncbi:tyrosine--tRNA ligase [Candidatus Saccharibacteria bacterium]|nr:tyrosine--tRNA ligase [Candidatus Saccharibacteria bacterium]
MKLSEELLWRGFSAETTIKNPADLDTREPKNFYWGADPSADSLTIGNLAALMMCACFVRHDYKPYLLVGGATGQIGDPKDNGERELKPLEEVEHNKKCLKAQIEKVIKCDDANMVDNYDWFKDMKYLDFLREIGKNFSMTQLLDRQFVQDRIGEGGSGISYAEFSYSLIQGYDFLHLYREHGVTLQLCGTDQYGNCTSGTHLIRVLENATADIWSTPLIIDPITGRKFGKSEGNAIWLSSKDNGQGNFTSIFDFYQFWLNQPDESVEYFLKIYTILEKPEIDDIMARHREHPEQRIAQKALAAGVTEVVHGPDEAKAVSELTAFLFATKTPSLTEIEQFAYLLPTISANIPVVDALVSSGLCASKSEARKFITQGAISFNGNKVTSEITLDTPGLLKRGKNKFAIVK